MELRQLENIRKEYKSKIITGIIIVAAITIGSFLVFPSIFVSMIVCLFSSVILLFVLSKPAQKYAKSYKAYFVQTTLEKYFTNIIYDHQKGFSKSYIINGGLISEVDKCNSDDLTIAEYKKVKFAQADVVTQRMDEDSDGNTTYVNTFRGRYMVYEFPRDFSFRLVLLGHRFANKNISMRTINHKYEKLETESSDFNKKFYIKSEDNFEAFYILDPAFINKLEKIYDAVDGRIALGFMDKKLHIALADNKNAFEPPTPLRTIDEAAEFAKVEKDIKIITSFVDDLCLDQYIFKK